MLLGFAPNPELAEYGMPGEAAYGAAKTGLQGLNRSLACELGPAGILVMPGMVSIERNLATIPTPVRDTVTGHSPIGRLSSPEDVAAAIVFLAAPANGNITGETQHVTGRM